MSSRPLGPRRAGAEGLTDSDDGAVAYRILPVSEHSPFTATSLSLLRRLVTAFLRTSIVNASDPIAKTSPELASTQTAGVTPETFADGH